MEEDQADPAIAELTAEITMNLRLLESNLVHRIDSPSISRSKLPSRVVWYKEAASWRFAELCRGAIESLSQHRLISGILLTRAAVETAAGIWFLTRKVESSVSTGTIGDIDDFVGRLLMGSKTDPEMREAINVMKFIDSVGKTIPDFRLHYERLSEYAHPNWAGTVLTFSKPEMKGRTIELASNIREAESTQGIGLANLSVALLTFNMTSSHFKEAMPEFIQLCERQLRSALGDS